MVALEYPVFIRGRSVKERLVAEYGERNGSGIRYSPKNHELRVPLRLLEDDVRSARLGEVLADRFLTPYTVIAGKDVVSSLTDMYVERAIMQAMADVVSDYGLAAANLGLTPEFFVLSKVRSRAAIYPPSQRLLWWADEARGNQAMLRMVTSRFEGVLERLRDSGTLIVRDGKYCIPHDVVVRILEKERHAWPIKMDFNVSDLIKAGKLTFLNPSLTVRALSDIGRGFQLNADPNKYVYIRTSIGYQRLSERERFKGLFPSSLLKQGYELRMRRRGYFFNSTYEADLVSSSGVEGRYFIKKYLSWTDLKWLAAKIWAFPIKTFYLSPSTRMSNELFFLSYLRERGFRIPNVYYVDWEDKLIIEQFIDGPTLTEAWASKKDVSILRQATRIAGELMARVHSLGIVIGDCKPDNIICASGDECWLVDLEQSSFGEEFQWDLAECMYYIGHYVDLRRSCEFAVNLVEGYLRVGSVETIEKALDPRYRFALSLWTPLWVEMKIADAVREVLRA